MVRPAEKSATFGRLPDGSRAAEKTEDGHDELQRRAALQSRIAGGGAVRP
jgi:hypothetical protein